jgi:hypothetical protein
MSIRRDRTPNAPRRCSSTAALSATGIRRSSPTAQMARHESSGEIHFGWVQEGRAIQDVWMIPRLADRSNAEPFPVAGNWYGTTLRIYDPTIEAWRIYWIDPARNVFRQQIGRARGEDIVQEGTTDTGMLSRWSFTRITPNSFHWLGEAKSESDTDWRLLVEVLARRREN